MNQLTPEQQAQTMAMLASMFGINQPQPQFQQQQFAPQPTTGLPIGCYGRDHNGVLLAKTVNGLTTWDETVLCEDGGTNDGLKVLFVKSEELKKNDKSFSNRKGYMARFEICCPRGKNPINEVVNVFMKDKFSHVPYLDPRKWDSRLESVSFRNLDDNSVRQFRIVIITFDGEIISDDVHRKCVNVLDRLKGLYVYTIDGVEYDEEGPYGADEEAEAAAK